VPPNGTLGEILPDSWTKGGR